RGNCGDNWLRPGSNRLIARRFTLLDSDRIRTRRRKRRTKNKNSGEDDEKRAARVTRTGLPHALEKYFHLVRSGFPKRRPSECFFDGFCLIKSILFALLCCKALSANPSPHSDALELRAHHKRHRSNAEIFRSVKRIAPSGSLRRRKRSHFRDRQSRCSRQRRDDRRPNSIFQIFFARSFLNPS